MQRRHRTAHARIWTVLAVALPVALVAALAFRQTVPEDRPAVLIEAPAGEAQR
jgi:hypothetical protein